METSIIPPLRDLPRPQGMADGLPRQLQPEVCRSLFILNFILHPTPAKAHRFEGPGYHDILRQWIESGLTAEEDLQAWLQECVPSFSADRKHLARACRESDALDAKGIWAAVFDADLPPSGHHPSCPQVLFGKGPLDRSHPWVAVFNSRKRKGPQPEAPWLQALRSLLRYSDPERKGFASSLGTLTYDLITAHAQRAGAPLLLLLPTAMEDLCTGRSENSPVPLHAFHFPPTVMTCLTRAVHCPKATRMACRDRLLASLADLHWVLEIRAGGNMEAVLNAQQAHRLRVQWVLTAGRTAAATDGSVHLTDRFPRWSREFSLESTFDDSAPNPKFCPAASLPTIPAPRLGSL
ncbi:hypothetical protein, partial [Desulforhabdus sp. TSK]|uniref:hypothetical protein n=1 Tax=Desulforhabdus sp. TSK TaxID=2925014 RepID=UPI001FC820ED